MSGVISASAPGNFGGISAEEMAEGHYGAPFTPPGLAIPTGRQEALLSVIQQVRPDYSLEFARMHTRYLRDNSRTVPNYLMQDEHRLTPEQRDTIMAAYALLFK